MDGSIIIWNLKKFQSLSQVQKISVPYAIQSNSKMDNGILKIVFIPLSNSIACIDLDRKVTYINLETFEIDKQLQAAYDGQLTSICHNEMRHEIAVGDESGEIKVFSNLDGKLIYLD